MKIALSIAALGFLFGACTPARSVDIVVTDKVINADYIGNGVEWDPYDEALSWGTDVGEKDWEKLFSRLDNMKPGYVRCMINSPYKYYDGGKYEESRNIASLTKLLGYCQRNDIHVIFGEYNPPHPRMKDSGDWVSMSVAFLNHLVSDCGFTCIKEFVIFNEPDGSWAAPDGDYDLWLSMAKRFGEEMDKYAGLRSRVSLAGPDVVMNYRNPASHFGTEGWVANAAADIDSLIGVYDVHSYPGQAEVRDGSYSEKLRRIKSLVPEGKKVLLGEAGFKYQGDPRDSLLWNEYKRRCEGHPFTRGSDCNMLVYDYFYGLDMPLLAMEAMNAGFSGLAAWMLDDAMHSNGDAGKPEDIKIWGMWNILGEEAFGDEGEEEVRPWYLTWSLMCRYFPAGTDVLSIDAPVEGGLRYVAGRKDGRYSLAAVNVSDSDRRLQVRLPVDLVDGMVFLYREGSLNLEGERLSPVDTALSGRNLHLDLPAGSLVLLTNMN